MVMQRYAEAQILEAVQVRADGQRWNGRKRYTGHRHQFDYSPRRGFLYVRSRAISSRTNDNHDTFPAEEIKQAYRTFIGKPVFINHRNEDPGRARGVVIDAALHEDANPDGTPDTWVEVLMEVDAVRFPVLAQKILSGEIDRTSMGTNVEFSVCSFCDNKAHTPLEYCAHIQRMKGHRLVRTTASGRKESVLVSEVCYGLGFFENSLLVEPPADPTAHFLGVDSRGVEAARKVAGRRVAERFDATVGDDHNVYHLSGVHHTSCGRWLGRKAAAGDQDSLESRLERVHPHIEPVRFVVEGARAYSQAHGLEDPHASGYRHVQTNPGRIQRLGAAYDRLPNDDPAAHAAFTAMRDQVNEQYHHLTHRMGVRVEPVDYDPYPDHKAMAADLARKRLRVLSTKATGGHPIFTNEENDRFRAVHDAFGHAATGRAFDAHGEEAAWLAHSRMFHGDARRAMTSETRGQNGSLLVNRGFGPQKIALLPAALHEREAARPRVATPDEARDWDLSPEEREERWPELLAALQTEAAPRHADPGQHPWFQANPVHHDNIIEHWNRATDEEKDLGKRWYPDAHFVAKALGRAGLERTGRKDVTDDEAAHVGAGVLASYSPQASWPVNMLNASNALRTGKAPGGKGSGVFATASMAGQAQKIMDGQRHETVLKGPKIQDFAHLIEHGGDADPDNPRAVIDRHALSVAAGRRLHVNEIEHAPLDNRHYYGHVVHQYHEAAHRISASEGEPIHAHQVQATTWLVRQRENATADAASTDRLDRGRTQRSRDDATAWQEHAREHYPNLVGPGYHNARLRATAYGEQVAPPQVDTLRPEDCPICGDRDTFDGETCQVCGYIAPPDQFTDPNLELAQQVDLRDGADPDDGEPPEGEDEDDPDDGGGDEDEDEEDPARPPQRTSTRHPEGTGVRMGNQARSNQAQRQRSRLTAALSQQQQTIIDQHRQLGEMRSVLAFVVEVAGLSRHPRVATLMTATQPSQPDSPARMSYRAGYQTGVRDRTSAANLASPVKLAEFEEANEDWQVGWDDGYHDRTPATEETLASRRTAGDESKEPVARSSDEAWNPDATDSPENYGAAPAPANADVTPAATTDAQSTDVAIPQPAFNDLEDVSEQRDLIPPPPGEPSHVVQDIQTVPQPDIRPAFPIPEPTSFTSAMDPQARFFAALRLAKARRTVGTSGEDELTLAQSIMDGGLSDEAVAVETSTLEAVSGEARPRQAQATTVRALVPRAAGQRAMPSLTGAGQAPPRRVQAGAGSGSAPTPDEFLDM